MSDLWVKPVPGGLSLEKARRFSLDARALAKAEETSLMRVGRRELLLAIVRLRPALGDALCMVGEVSAQVHPCADSRSGDGWWRWSA